MANILTDSQGRVAMLRPDGAPVWIPEDRYAEAKAGGYQPDTAEQIQRRELAERYGNEPLKALGVGLLSGSTLGASDLVLKEMFPGEDFGLLKEANPIASTVGDVAGMAGGALLGGPVAALGRGAAGLGARAAAGVAGATGRQALGKVAGAGVRSAVEGAGIAGGEFLGESALAGADLSSPETWKQAVGEMAKGALFGGGLGLFTGGAGVAVDAFKGRIGKGLVDVGRLRARQDIAQKAYADAVQAGAEQKIQTELGQAWRESAKDYMKARVQLAYSLTGKSGAFSLLGSLAGAGAGALVGGPLGGVVGGAAAWKMIGPQISKQLRKALRPKVHIHDKLTAGADEMLGNIRAKYAPDAVKVWHGKAGKAGEKGVRKVYLKDGIGEDLEAAEGLVDLLGRLATKADGKLPRALSAIAKIGGTGFKGATIYGLTRDQTERLAESVQDLDDSALESLTIAGALEGLDENEQAELQGGASRTLGYLKSVSPHRPPDATGRPRRINSLEERAFKHRLAGAVEPEGVVTRFAAGVAEPEELESLRHNHPFIYEAMKNYAEHQVTLAGAVGGRFDSKTRRMLAMIVEDTQETARDRAQMWSFIKGGKQGPGRPPSPAAKIDMATKMMSLSTKTAEAL